MIPEEFKKFLSCWSIILGTHCLQKQNLAYCNSTGHWRSISH